MTVEAATIPRVARHAPAAFLLEQHRRVLRLILRLDASQNDFKLVEGVSLLCDELRQLVALECGILQPLLHETLPNHFAIGTEAHARRAEMVALAETLEATIPGETRFESIVNQIFDCACEHLKGCERELMPHFETMPADRAELLDTRLRDMKERMVER